MILLLLIKFGSLLLTGLPMHPGSDLYPSNDRLLGFPISQKIASPANWT